MKYIIRSNDIIIC